MIFRDSANAGGEPTQDIASFQIVVTVAVDNADALWGAALRRHRRIAQDLEIDEIVESIGPPDDPSVEDCLTTMALALKLDGCSIRDIDVQSAPLPPRPAMPAMALAAQRPGNHFQIIVPGAEPIIRAPVKVPRARGRGFRISPL